MTRALHELFPTELGPYEDEPYFTQFVNHALLKAEYENDDFQSAKVFAKKDPRNTVAKRMAGNIITFKLYKCWSNIKHFVF